MPVVTMEYCPEKFLRIEGITHNYVFSRKVESALTKEYYSCELCDARMYIIFKETLKCELITSHKNEDCKVAYKKWKEEKGKNILQKGDITLLESVLGETATACFMTVNRTDIEEDEDDERSRIFDESNNTTLTQAMNDQTDMGELESVISYLNMAMGEETMTAEGAEACVSSVDMYELTVDLNTARGEETMIAEGAEAGVSSLDSVSLSKKRENSINVRTLITPIKRQSAAEAGFYVPTPAPK